MPVAKYNVNEVEERTRVAATTLRQWERRYGVPKPERSSSGYRLYSDEDVRLIEAMKRHIADGIPASRAAEIVKQLYPSAPKPRPLEELQGELFEALAAFDERRANDILSEAHALHPVDAVMLRLMQATMVEIGQKWHEGKISSATEHYASHYISGRLRALFSISADVKTGPAVIVACAPLEQHELGPLILAVMLRRAGYRVYYIGADTPVEDLGKMAAALRPAGVLVSASTAESAGKLLEKRELLVGTAPIVVYGGTAFNDAPELVAALGGYYLGKAADEAVARFHELVQGLEAVRREG